MFNYFPANTGSVQSFTAPKDGTYKLEVWGAQGGYAIDATKAFGGYGGMSSGRKYLIKENSLYIVVGGQGGSVFNHSQTGTGGYNGGGKAVGDGVTGWGGGGGATHIATVTGLLSNLSSQISQILIVAGGGGGGGYFDYTEHHYPHSGGDGGGISGNIGSSEANDGGSGGTQMSGFAFGLGQDGKNSGNGSGGGGGYYGGYSGYTYGSAAGGGSGYLGTSLISGTIGMSNGVRSGNGYCIVSWIP